MEAKRVLVCLAVCVCFVGVVGEIAQMGAMCRPNERLLPCGCPKSCRDPAPDCRGVCMMGCYCEEGQVRNDDGICVNLADCPPMAAPYRQLHTSEPRFQPCPVDHEYSFCETCNRTCSNPNPVCPAQCARGCFCKGDLLKDTDGRCVKFEKCSNFEDYIREREKNVAPPIPYRYTCGKNQEYVDCRKCTQSCSDPEPVCGKCKSGCVCKEGFLKGPNGQCVTRPECPIAVITSAVYETIEDCTSNEQYFSCGWCEPSCQDPTPSCPDLCTAGCLCKQPLLRHASGLCVSRQLCEPQNCTDPNEEYGCRFGCEPKCKPSFCFNRSRQNRRCVLQCHCRMGLLRNEFGKCVKKDECFTNLQIL